MFVVVDRQNNIQVENYAPLCSASRDRLSIWILDDPCCLIWTCDLCDFCSALTSRCSGSVLRPQLARSTVSQSFQGRPVPPGLTTTGPPTFLIFLIDSHFFAQSWCFRTVLGTVCGERLRTIFPLQTAKHMWRICGAVNLHSMGIQTIMKYSSASWPGSSSTGRGFLQ